MSRRVATSLLVASLVVGTLGAYSLLGSGGDTYRVTAEVPQAPNLFSGGRVMVRGIEVGRIADVEPSPQGVLLSLELRADVPVPADATLAVIPVTVISDRYVQLFPAYEGGPTLADGDHIEETSVPAELEEVLAQLKGLLEALEPQEGAARGSLSRLVRSLDEVFANRSEELSGALEGSADVLGNLARSSGDITGLIRNLDRLFAALANRSSQIGLVNQRFELVVEALLADQANLEGTIENLAFLADEAAGLVDTSGDHLGSSVTRLGRVLRAVLRHQEELASGMKWANVIAQTVGAVDPSGKGRFAYTGLQAPPGTDGAEYNFRIDTRDVITCERIQKVADSVIAVLPAADEAEVQSTLLSFIPDPYDDHVAFLLELLIPFCVDQFAPTTSLSPAAQEALRAMSEELGRQRVLELLGGYLLGEVSP